MAKFFRSVFTLIVLVLAYGVLIKAFDLMNLPSNRFFFTGVAMILGLLIVLPLMIRLIWRKEQ